MSNTTFSNHATWLFMTNLDDIQASHETAFQFMQESTAASPEEMKTDFHKFLVDGFAQDVIDNGHDKIDLESVHLQEIADYTADNYWMSEVESK